MLRAIVFMCVVSIGLGLTRPGLRAGQNPVQGGPGHRHAPSAMPHT
jgi:hypothetical protein